MTPRLQVLICTYGRRVESIDTAGLPRLDEVEYIVCHQNPTGEASDITALEQRPDIKLYTFADLGGSRNRNHTYDVSTAPYILFSDDDLSYDAEGLRAIIAAFDADPTLDMVTTRSVIPEHHIYPPDGHRLDRPFPHYSPIAFELALRRSAMERTGLRFSELTGIGAPYLPCGEENFFFHKAIRSGLKGVYRDVVVSTHRGPTTCTHQAATAGFLRAKGAFMRFDRGTLTALSRYPVEAVRAQLPFMKALLYLSQGFIYSIKHRHEL